MKKPKFKKLKKLKRPGNPVHGVRRLARRNVKTPEEKVSDALSNVPRITNETVSEHREEVLSSARKYIYPLQHSKHRVVRTSIGLLALVVVGFFVVCGLDLYKFQGTSGFIYDVTRIVPFPAAKTGKHWVSYESYLFELRRNMHYYQSQQGSDFSTKDGKLQLTRLKQEAMAQVIQNSYVNQLAAEHDVSVSDQAVDAQVTLVRSENRLGSSDRAFREVLNEFWGWDEADFKRELKQQLLTQAVVAKLDTATQARAAAAIKQLQAGADFGTLAGQVSDDGATKANGGQYPAPVTLNDPQISPIITAELFNLKPGQTSGIINSGFTLDILKVLDRSGDSLHAAHIQFNLQSIGLYTQPLETQHPPHYYIKTN